MGQYLVIGIATHISADKAKAAKEFKSIDNFKIEFEKNFNSNGLYQIEETDNYIHLCLKPEIAEKEWLNFIETFFRLRYPKDDRQSETLEKLSQADKLQAWLDLAERNKAEWYQSDHLYFYPMENPYYYQRFYVGMDLVVLSLDGKIIMECYNELFAFFTRLIREKLADYRLADSLFMYITE